MLAYLDAKNGTNSEIDIDEKLKLYIELANKMTEIKKRKNV